MRSPNTARYEILGLLVQGPRHGYELYQEFGDPQGLGQVWHLGMSLMYQELKKLEAQGLVQSTLELQDVRPPKKVFTLTPRGRRAFQEWMNAPARGMRELRVEFLVRLYFARRAGAQQVQELVQRQASSLRQELESFLSARAARGPSGEFADWVHKFRQSQIQAALQWLETQLLQRETR